MIKPPKSLLFAAAVVTTAACKTTNKTDFGPDEVGTVAEPIEAPEVEYVGKQAMPEEPDSKPDEKPDVKPDEKPEVPEHKVGKVAAPDRVGTVAMPMKGSDDPPAPKEAPKPPDTDPKAQ